MSSKGTDVSLYIAKEQSPNTLPLTPEWHTLRRVSDSLKKTVELTASGEVIDSVFEQGSVASSATASGAINFEFSALSQDMFLEGVSRNVFIVDAVDTDKSVLEIGGDNDLATFTIVKHDRKLSRIEVFSGARVGELTISASTDGMIEGAATITATGYAEPTVLPVANPLPATETPFTSALNVAAFKINGVNTAGTACAESFEITINNNLDAKGCLGNSSLIKSRVTEGRVAVGLSSTVLLTAASKAWIKNVETRDRMTAEIEILDKLGNSYKFGFTKLELDNDGLSDTTAEDEHTLGLEFKHVKEAITITRTLNA